MEESAQDNNFSGINEKNPSIIKSYLFVAWEFVKIVIIAAVIVLPIRYFLFQPFIVKGESMVPNFHSGDYLIVDEISYAFRMPKRGEVIVLKYPQNISERFIKRIIGLPGERVRINNGKITILKNGSESVLDEKEYLPILSLTKGNIDMVLGDGEYFVLGDNRQFSYDSRLWGALPKEDIVGRAFLRIYPFSDISYILTATY